MDDVKIAHDLTQEIDRVPEPYRMEAFKILLRARLGPSPGLRRDVKDPSATTNFRSPGITFSEFYGSLKPEPRGNPQRFAAVAYFHREHRGEPLVTQSDIRDSFGQAGLSRPKNFPRDVAMATGRKLGLLMAAENRKDGQRAWALTRTGASWIASVLQNDKARDS